MTDDLGLDVADSVFRWTDDDGHRWRVHFTWKPVNGRIECVAVDLTSQDDRPVTAALLRSFPIGALMAKHRRRQAQAARWSATDPRLQAIRSPEGQRQRLAQAREWEREQAGRSGPKGLGAEHFAKVASVYERELQRSNKPTQAVADHFTVSKSAAAKWVARCRTMGLLPPARKGKAG